MQDCQKLMRGRNNETPANTVGRGLWWRTRPASCGVLLRRSTTSDGAVNTTGRVTTAAVLRLRWRACGGLAGCSNTLRKRRRGQRTDWRSLPELAGIAPSMAGGYARFGRAPTATGRTSRHGFTTTERTRLLNSGGSGQQGRTKSVFMTSAGKRRTSRLSASERRTPRLWNFGTNCCAWR